MDTDAKEIMHTVTSDFMTENPATCTSVVSEYRVKKDHWKGMNTEQKKQILDEMGEQVAEGKKKKELEKEADALWAAQEEAKRQELIKQTLEKQQKERMSMTALKETHVAQKAEKVAKWPNYYGEKLPEEKPSS